MTHILHTYLCVHSVPVHHRKSEVEFLLSILHLLVYYREPFKHVVTFTLPLPLLYTINSLLTNIHTMLAADAVIE